MSKHGNSIDDYSLLTKPYSCFVCSKNSSDKGLPLLISETTYSRICLGQKLQEILGDKLVLLLNQKDSVCWKCATFINRFDKYEHELDLIKDHVFSALLKKYNCSLDDVTEIVDDDEKRGTSLDAPLLNSESPALNQVNKNKEKLKPLKRREEEPIRPSLPPPSSLVKNKTEKPKVRFNPQVKVKNVPVNNHKVVDKPYNNEHPPQQTKLTSTPVSAPSAAVEDTLPSDKRRNSEEIPQDFQCQTCLHAFPTFDIYEKHVKLHNLAKSSRYYKCKICEFSSTNLEIYCRHVCNFNTGKYVECVDCKKSFLGGISDKEIKDFVCQQCHANRSKQIIDDSLITETPLARTPCTEIQPPPLQPILPKPTASIPPPPPPALSPVVPSSVLQPKTKPMVRKLTAEGSIEYEEVPDSNDQRIGPNSSDEIVVDESLEPVVTVKNEIIDDEIKELVLPDHIIEHINSKSSMNSPYMLKCSNCGDVLDVRNLPTHRCFLELESVEFSEVDNALEIDMGLAKKEHDEEGVSYVDQDGCPIMGVVEDENDENYQPRLLCKTCFQQFPSITQLRMHWQETGHAWEVGTVNVDVKTIKDKVKDNEQTFKVVKQMFSMKANLPVQHNALEAEFNDDHMFNIKNMFVKVRSNNECDTCGKVFPTEEVLKDHQVDECLTCTFCNIRFLSNGLLKKHYQCTGHWRKIIRDQDPSTKPPPLTTPICPHCGKEFYSRYSLGMHLKTHYKGTDKGACHYCFKEFEEKNDIYQHVVDVHNAQLFKCAYCDATFLSEWKKDKHQVVKHKSQTVECKLCNIKLRSLKLLLKHNEQYHREKNCRICGKHIGSWQSLRRHERRHFYEKGLQCTLCQKSFRNKTALKVHNGTHHKEEFKFHCDNCDSGFMTVEALEEHRIVHLKTKKACSKCGKKFKSRTALWMHMKMHDGPYTCSVCSRVFRDTSLLAVHLRMKHLHARPYQCPHCPRAFSVSRTLRRHMARHTQAYPYRCAVCRKGFISRYAYRKHMETNHGTIQTPRRTSTLPLDPTDDDIFQAADTLISDDSVMLNGNYQRNDDSSELITEVVVETTELFEEILS